jgi:hypothetical protein
VAVEALVPDFSALTESALWSMRIFTIAPALSTSIRRTVIEIARARLGEAMADRSGNGTQ